MCWQRHWNSINQPANLQDYPQSCAAINLSSSSCRCITVVRQKTLITCNCGQKAVTHQKLDNSAPSTVFWTSLDLPRHVDDAVCSMRRDGRLRTHVHRTYVCSRGIVNSVHHWSKAGTQLFRLLVTFQYVHFSTCLIVILYGKTLNCIFERKLSSMYGRAGWS